MERIELSLPVVYSDVSTPPAQHSQLGQWSFGQLDNAQTTRRRTTFNWLVTPASVPIRLEVILYPAIIYVTLVKRERYTGFVIRGLAAPLLYYITVCEAVKASTREFFQCQCRACSTRLLCSQPFPNSFSLCG